jgi:hypothetical protein
MKASCPLALKTDIPEITMNALLFEDSLHGCRPHERKRLRLAQVSRRLPEVIGEEFRRRWMVREAWRKRRGSHVSNVAREPARTQVDEEKSWRRSGATR